MKQQMYTSFMSGASRTAGSSRGFKQRNFRNAPPTREDLATGIEMTSLLKLNQRILGGKAVVTHVICDTACIIYHEDFRQEFIIRQIPDEEDISNWIDLQTHTNVTTAFDSFIEEVSGCHFSMVENTTGGNIFNYIKKMNLNLAIDVPRSYIEMIYDVAIQLATGMDFAHNSGLVHGQFDLSKVVIQSDNNNMMYKITDFAPRTSMEMPLSPEASYWPFSKQKKQISDREKMEVIMLKDIYTLGIAILELMIGRTSKTNFSISLDSLPLTWAEFPESTPLIQVLVECIQIDSITQRKGRLQAIRKLLVREYKKFFKKPIYKMETPFVGKKADVYNKKGIVALFHNKEKDALEWWSKARLLSDRHFDSVCNFVMHRWTRGHISDSQMLAELSEFVFSVPGKGQTLHAYLLICCGEREQGIVKLKDFIAEAKETISQQRRLQNLKIKKQLEQAEEVFDAVQLNKTAFFNNMRIKHGHKERVSHISFSPDSAFMTTIDKGETKLWRIVQSILANTCSIPASAELDKTDENASPVAAVDSRGRVLAVYRGRLMITIYDLNESSEQFKRRDAVNLRREIIANGGQEFGFTPSRDKVTEIKLVADADGNVTHMKVFMKVAQDFFMATVDLADNVTELRQIEQYADNPIFSLDAEENPQVLVRQENMRRLIAEQSHVGNEVLFASDDTRIVAVFNKEDKSEKYYVLYDNLRNEFIRRVAKKTMYDEAACINNVATLIALIEDSEIVIRSIRMPNNAVLIDQLRPRICQAESKLNPAQACLNRQTFRDKLYRELHAYHMFKENPLAEKSLGLTEEQNVQLMVLQYEDGVNHPYKLKANRELMMLQKVLLRDAVKTTQMKDLQKECPLIGVAGSKRIEVYDDELSFESAQSTVSMVAMSSEPHRNFFLLAMEGIVYKYDLVSRELLFRFHTHAQKAIHLYDKDDKLVAASETEIRLWDFYDHKEEAPELITALQLPHRIEHIFINQNSKTGSALYVLATFGPNFTVYTGRLEVKFEGVLDSPDEVITCGAFTKDASLMILGTSLGKIVTYNVASGQMEGTPFQAAGPDLAVTQLETLMNIEDNDAFLMVVAGKELYIYIHNKKDCREVDYGDDGQVFMGEPISQVKVAFNNKFFMIGVPSKRAIGFFGLNRVQLSTKPLKFITKYPFVDFFADDHLSTMMLLEDQCRSLDFQYILWRFDTNKLDHAMLAKLDAGPGGVEDDEDIDSQDSEGNEVERRPVDQIKGSSCCTIF